MAETPNAEMIDRVSEALHLLKMAQGIALDTESDWWPTVAAVSAEVEELHNDLLNGQGGTDV